MCFEVSGESSLSAMFENFDEAEILLDKSDLDADRLIDDAKARTERERLNLVTLFGSSTVLEVRVLCFVG